MAFKVRDRVMETSSTTGTGDFTVAGAVTGYRAFSSVMSTNDTFYYCIQHQTLDEWEVGYGTYSGANTIARTTVLASSNSGNAVNFSAGVKDVFVTYPADDDVCLRHIVITLESADGSPIPTGVHDVMLPSSVSGTIMSWRLVADDGNASPSVTAVLDILKSTSKPVAGDTICASAKPSLTTASVATSSTLTSWTTTVAVGDIFSVEVESNDYAIRFVLDITLRTP